MDPGKFGAFVALCRKEKNMTQLELAQELKVTDKAAGKGAKAFRISAFLSHWLKLWILRF